ncbi:hypothetical protein EVAR_38611_1 [Eumeta japonica]|uniref:Uncharacterized protein n=1 Tax=Eumeta variegata TaxID=151549 RepID=A0A4C1WU08_EUMVA|nr:hypothetical protein EVAR_38611_1 [Eumeta japonica]
MMRNTAVTTDNRPAPTTASRPTRRYLKVKRSEHPCATPEDLPEDSVRDVNSRDVLYRRATRRLVTGRARADSVNMASACWSGPCPVVSIMGFYPVLFIRINLKKITLKAPSHADSPTRCERTHKRRIRGALQISFNNVLPFQNGATKKKRRYEPAIIRRKTRKAYLGGSREQVSVTRAPRAGGPRIATAHLSSRIMVFENYRL